MFYYLLFILGCFFSFPCIPNQQCCCCHKHFLSEKYNFCLHKDFYLKILKVGKMLEICLNFLSTVNWFLTLERDPSLINSVINLWGVSDILILLSFMNWFSAVLSVSGVFSVVTREVVSSLIIVVASIYVD